MRIFTTLPCILYWGILLAQTPGPDQLNQKVVNYYQKNQHRLGAVRNHHNNVFKYDTTISTFYYLPLAQNEKYLFFADSTYSISGGIYFSDKCFVVNAGVTGVSGKYHQSSALWNVEEFFGKSGKNNLALNHSSFCSLAACPVKERSLTIPCMDLSLSIIL